VKILPGQEYWYSCERGGPQVSLGTSLGTTIVPLHVSTDRPLRGHIRRPKGTILEASVSIDKMVDISESTYVWRSEGHGTIGKRFVWLTV